MTRVRRSTQGLLDELTVGGVSLLYELMVVAQQSNWADEPQTFFTVQWIVDVVQQVERHHLVSSQSVCQFLELLVSPSRLCLYWR